MKKILTCSLLFIQMALSAQVITVRDLCHAFEKEKPLDSLFDLYYAHETPDWQGFSRQTESILNDSARAYFLLEISQLLYRQDSKAASSLLGGVVDMPYYEEDPVLQVMVADTRGFLLAYEGDYTGSLETLFAALEILDKNEYPIIYGNLLQTTSATYSVVDDLENALKYAHQARSLFARAGHAEKQIEIAFSLGAIFMQQYAFDSAEFYFSQVLKEIEGTNSSLEANTYGNLAQVYAFLGQYQRSLKLQQKGIAMERRFGDEFSMVESNIILAACYCGLRKVDSCNYYFEEATAIAEKYDLVEKQLDVFEAKSLAYPLAGEFELAFEALTILRELEDSIKTVKVDELRLDLQEKYETNEKEAENQLLSLKNRQQSRMLVGAGILIVLAIAIVLYIFRLQRKTQHLNERISAQAVSLNQLNKTKDRLFSIIGHDLRGPITAFETVTSVIQNYLDKKDFSKVDEILDQVDQSAKSLKLLLNNLLNWSLSQQEEIQLNIGPLLLQPLVDDALEAYRDAASQKQIRLVSKLQAEKVQADEDTLSTVFRNLISNAIKFSPMGSEIRIEPEIDGQFLKIKVTDQGIGIPENKINKLFIIDKEKVRRGTSKEKGSGLGLVLVKEFVEMNQGTIQLSSEEGKGSTFSISLPRAS